MIQKEKRLRLSSGRIVLKDSQRYTARSKRECSYAADYLFKKGAKINLLTASEVTALHLAALPSSAAP
jgi:hypothetical protein